MWFHQRLELPTVSSSYDWKMEKESSSKGSFGASRTVLSKAFDCVPHELMIAKLDGYGFDLKALILVFNYLPNTKQRVKINSSYNDWYDLVIGVSQRSILGPLLFIIFIYDWFYFEEMLKLQTTVMTTLRIVLVMILQAMLMTTLRIVLVMTLQATLMITLCIVLVMVLQTTPITTLRIVVVNWFWFEIWYWRKQSLQKGNPEA